MDKNLVGYLLNCLDEDAHREVEARLATDPESRDKLDKLRLALEPLEADRDNAEPPRDLVYRTLARVAEHCSQALPRSPVASQAGGAERPFWRRADVVAAAAVLLLAVGIGIPAIYRTRDSANLVACQNNLREFHNGLNVYHDQKRQFPNVKSEAPHSAAGMVVPMLVGAGALAEDANVRCPGNGPGRACPFTLDQIRAMSPEEFQKHAGSLASCYAYSLGYRDGAGYHSPARNDAKASRYPIMSDRPPYDDDRSDNSPNHGKTGQNVLFQDGHVKFLKERSLPFDSDIFKNRFGKVAPGDGEDDFVLGDSASRP